MEPCLGEYFRSYLWLHYHISLELYIWNIFKYILILKMQNLFIYCPCLGYIHRTILLSICLVNRSFWYGKINLFISNSVLEECYGETPVYALGEVLMGSTVPQASCSLSFPSPFQSSIYLISQFLERHAWYRIFILQEFKSLSLIK